MTVIRNYRDLLLLILDGYRKGIAQRIPMGVSDQQVIADKLERLMAELDAHAPPARCDLPRRPADRALLRQR